jgi:hypothetical protein
MSAKLHLSLWNLTTEKSEDGKMPAAFLWWLAEKEPEE